MGRDQHIKMMLKVLNNKNEHVEWVHFCYANRDLYNKFLKEKNLTSNDLNDIVARWCKEDFNIDVAMVSTEDIIILKEVIKDFYKRAHPEFYVENKIDQQGWTRTWVTRKMMEELNLYARRK